MRIISQGEAKPRLEPHHDAIIGCVKAGWDKWILHVAPQLPLPDRRTRPTIVHNFITDEARRRFCDVPGVSVIQAQGRFLVSIDNKFIIYFKQLDRTLRTRNYPTDTAVKFDAQEPIRLPGIPDICRITIGYIPSDITQSISAIYVSLLRGKTVQWSYELIETHRGELLTFPQIAKTPPVSIRGDSAISSPPKKPRIRPKKTEISDDEQQSANNEERDK